MEDVYPENYNSKVLVEMWADFINWDKRRLGENGFLLNTLKKFHCQKIFDACLGDGADSLHLLENGFNATSNDLEPWSLKLKAFLCYFSDNPFGIEKYL